MDTRHVYFTRIPISNIGTTDLSEEWYIFMSLRLQQEQQQKR